MSDLALQQQSRWSGGLVEWTEGDTAFLSIAFTWMLNEARSRATWYRALGYKVRAGGPATFVRKNYLADVAELGGAIPDAVRHHNPMATIASRGCPVGCWFCIVPKMEGKAFTLLPDFPVRPILCDNNLSGLEAKYQDYIIERYVAERVPLLDANSGFEPRTFDGSVYERWRRINRGPWRFAFDDLGEFREVEQVLRMLRDESPKKTRVYVLIGNEPFEDCMARLHFVLANGGEPHVQPYIKLNALDKTPHVRFDWTAKLLIDVARWANRRIWRYAPFDEYRRSAKTQTTDRYDAQQGAVRMSSAQITRIARMSMQVCVPADWTDAQVEAFANASLASSTANDWKLRAADHPAQAGAPIRVRCRDFTGYVHIMLSC